MKLETITPVILTLNEEANIGRCLSRLDWASRVVVIDSGSTDRTLEIVSQHPRCSLVQRDFDSHADQWNFGVQQVDSEWVLSLDADYILSDEWVPEIQILDPPQKVVAFETQFVYQIQGTSLRASLYPPRPVLFRKPFCEYWDDGHTQRLQVTGETAQLRSAIFHDDRKPLSLWYQAQLRYTRLEADKLLSQRPEDLDRIDRLRKMGGPMALLTPLYCLILKGLLFQGWPGWHYTLQRTVAEALLSLEILDRRIKRGKGSGGTAG